MSQEYRRIQTDFGTLIVRRYELKDIPAHATYLFDSPEEFLEEIGFDTSKLPNKTDWVLGVEKRLTNGASKNSSPNVIIGEMNGETIGMVFYDPHDAEDKTPRLHFHIFENRNRGKGLGALLFNAGVEAFSAIYGIQRFIIEPKQTNQRMNGLMKKLGFLFLKNYLLDAGPVTQQMLVNQYEIVVQENK